MDVRDGVVPLYILLLVNILRESTSGMSRSTLQMEAEGFSETLVHMYHTTWHYIPEDCSLHSHCRDNLRSEMDIRMYICTSFTHSLGIVLTYCVSI
jgi:hypothetical protein